jgi:hypothetical protein
VLPKLQHDPPLANEILHDNSPPFFVGMQFISPKQNVAFWLPVTFITTMPKATIDKNRCFLGFVGQVWLSNNGFVMNSISLFLGPKQFSNCSLGLCVF